jgi:hypothetical protein
VVKGESPKVAVILFDVHLPSATTARYLRLTQTRTGVTGNFWSINEMDVYGEVKQ